MNELRVDLVQRKVDFDLPAHLFHDFRQQLYLRDLEFKLVFLLPAVLHLAFDVQELPHLQDSS